MQPQAGDRVGSSVRLLRPLDAGAMGSLWVGRYPDVRMEVAVKFILEEAQDELNMALDRFQREASVLGKLSNVHVVRMFEQGRLGDGTPYIIMELLRGETLLERLERSGEWLSLEQVGVLLAQLAEALEHVHSHGFVHRDLKAENVFLVGDPDQLFAKIIDFGLAKTPEMPGHPKLTAAGMVVGSPEYLSPEQIVSSMTVDHYADLWAMGVLAYVVVTLEFPFQAEKLGELFATIRSGRFTPPSRHREQLPAAVDAWFATAFQQDRTKRFASAKQMSEAWQQAIPQPAEGASIGFPRSLLIALGVSGLMLLIILAVVLTQCGS